MNSADMNLDPAVDKIEICIASKPNKDEPVLRAAWLFDEDHEQNKQLFGVILIDDD